MSLYLEYLFRGTEGVFRIPNRTSALLDIGAVKEDFMTLQKCDLGDIGISVYFYRSGNVVFG